MSAKSGRYWLTSAFFTVSDRLAVQVMGMGTVMILLRHFADRPETYGVWAMYLMIGSFIEVSRNGLIQSALIKFLGGASEETYRSVVTSSAVLNLIFTGIVGSLIMVCAPWLAQLVKAPGLDVLIRIYVLTNVLLLPMVQFNFLQQANLNFKGILLANLVRQGLFFGFIVATVTMGRRLELINLAWAQAGIAVLASAVSWWSAKPYLRYNLLPDLVWVQRLARYGFYTFGTNLSTMLYKTIDRFMLGILLPTQAAAMQAVALFDPAMRITNVMEIPIQSMASITFPQSAKRMAEEGLGAVKHLYEKSVGTVLALLMPICLVVLLFPETFIIMLAGRSEAFRGAAAILQVTILYTLFVPYGRQFGIVMDTIGKPSFNFAFVLAGALSNIVSNYFFIREFGVIGAAYGTLLTLGLKFIAQQFILYHYMKIRPLRPLLYSLAFYAKAANIAWSVVRNPSSWRHLLSK
ncbi:MAG: oligosaccharide flippase family protein [Bacteroidetes bacterium]|nr:oligosaccharide flippase family protein [Bacteroidota bacterium]